MEVAVCIDFAGIACFKFSLRFFTGFEVTDVDAVVIDKGNPFDVMLFFHRVCHRTDVDFQVAIDFLDSRYVFFFSCIDGIGDKVRQFLTGIDEFFRYLCAYRY